LEFELLRIVITLATLEPLLNFAHLPGQAIERTRGSGLVVLGLGALGLGARGVWPARGTIIVFASELLEQIVVQRIGSRLRRLSAPLAGGGPGVGRLLVRLLASFRFRGRRLFTQFAQDLVVQRTGSRRLLG
jgi:hypothetical protein